MLCLIQGREGADENCNFFSLSGERYFFGINTVKQNDAHNPKGVQTVNRKTQTLRRNLAHNRALIDDINRSGLAKYYNTDILHTACAAIEAELRR